MGKKLLLVILVSIALVFFLSCAVWSQPGMASPAPPGMSLLKSKCGACHLRPNPRSHNEIEWERIMGAHRERVPMTEDELKALMDYLRQEGERP